MTAPVADGPSGWPVSAASSGMCARARRTTSSAVNTAGSGTPTPLVRVAAPIFAGRLYRVRVPLLMFAVNAAISALHLAVATLRITTDGSNPSNSSSLLQQSHTALPSGLGAAVPVAGVLDAPYAVPVGNGQVIGSPAGTLSALLSFYRGAGTAAGVYSITAAAYPLELVIDDDGIDLGDTGTVL